MSSLHVFPQRASDIPSISKLRGLLGYGDGIGGLAIFHPHYISFLEGCFPLENNKGDDFCHWKNKKHENLFVELASQYLDSHGDRFWPDSDTINGDPVILRWAKDKEILESLLTQLFFRTNYDKRRNNKKKSDDSSQQGPRKKHRTRSSTSARTNMPQLQPVEGPAIEPPSSPPFGIGPSSPQALARFLDHDTDFSVADGQGRSGEEHIDLSGISENENENENEIEQAPTDIHHDHTPNTHRRYSNQSDRASDVHGPLAPGRAPATGYIIESGESSTQSSMAENTMPAQVDLEHAEPSAKHELPQQRQKRNSLVEPTTNGRSAEPRDCEGVDDVAGSRGQHHLQVTEQLRHTVRTKNKFRMYYYIIGTRNTQGREPWFPEGNFTELTLEELIQQLPLENNPDALYFRLMKPDVEGPEVMEVPICPADTWKFGRVQKLLKEQVHDVVRTKLSSPEPVTCMIEIEPKWDETKFREIDDEWNGCW